MANVSLGENALFFPVAELTRGKGLKLQMQRGAAVCTKRFLFVVPDSSITVGVIKTKLSADAARASDALAPLLQRTDLTIEGLEQELHTLLGAQASDQVFEIAKLDMFKVWGFGPLLQVRIKPAGAIAPVVFVPRGKGAVKQLKAFYF